MGRGAASPKAAPSESLLRWVSQRCVSRAELQVALASLELSILQNISKKLEGNVGDGAKAALSREVRRLGLGCRNGRKRIQVLPFFFFFVPTLSLF